MPASFAPMPKPVLEETRNETCEVPPVVGNLDGAGTEVDGSMVIESVGLVHLPINGIFLGVKKPTDSNH